MQVNTSEITENGLVNTTCLLGVNDDNPLTGIEIMEIIILATVFLVGTFGNVLIITTLVYKKAVFKNAHVFILNLAISDVMVCKLLSLCMCAHIYAWNIYI